MKIKIDKDTLIERLKKAIRFIPTQVVVPALLNFKFTIKDNVMEIIANNGRVQLKVFCPVKADGDLSFCLPAMNFYKLASLFSDASIQLTKKEKPNNNKTIHFVEIKNGKSKYTITCDTLPEHYPVMTMKSTDSEIEIQQFYLKMAIKSAESFVDDDSSKFNADGINVAEINNRIIFTGISGRNMMCRVNVQPLSIKKWEDVVLPSETATKIFGMLEDKGDVSVCHNKDKIMVFTEGIDKFEIMSTLVVTKYPNSEALYEKKSTDCIHINAGEFQDAVKRLKLFTSDLDSIKKITIKLNPANPAEIVLQAIDTFMNKEGEELLTIKNNSEKPVNKVFNANQLLQILSLIESTEFTMFFVEDYRVPCFIDPKVDEGKENNFNFLVSTFSE